MFYFIDLSTSHFETIDGSFQLQSKRRLPIKEHTFYYTFLDKVYRELSQHSLNECDETVFLVKKNEDLYLCRHTEKCTEFYRFNRCRLMLHSYIDQLTLYGNTDIVELFQPINRLLKNTLNHPITYDTIHTDRKRVKIVEINQADFDVFKRKLVQNDAQHIRRMQDLMAFETELHDLEYDLVERALDLEQRLDYCIHKEKELEEFEDYLLKKEVELVLRQQRP